MRFDEKLKKYSREQLWQEDCGYLDMTLAEYMYTQRRLMEEQIRLWSACPLGRQLLAGKHPETLEDFLAQLPLTSYADYADTLLALLDRHLKLIIRPPAEKSPERRLLEELWLQVSDSLRRKWTLPQMAAKACMSVSTLIRQTKRHYDATPMQILYHLRLKYAAKLLLSTPQLPISMVALHCGYDNFAAFSTAFRKEYGTSPRLFRDRQTPPN